jgi:hypothetical protein
MQTKFSSTAFPGVTVGPIRNANEDPQLAVVRENEDGSYTGVVISDRAAEGGIYVDAEDLLRISGDGLYAADESDPSHISVMEEDWSTIEHFMDVEGKTFPSRLEAETYTIDAMGREGFGAESIAMTDDFACGSDGAGSVFRRQTRHVGALFEGGILVSTNGLDDRYSSDGKLFRSEADAAVNGYDRMQAFTPSADPQKSASEILDGRVDYKRDEQVIQDFAAVDGSITAYAEKKKVPLLKAAQDLQLAEAVDAKNPLLLGVAKAALSADEPNKLPSAEMAIKGVRDSVRSLPDYLDTGRERAVLGALSMGVENKMVGDAKVASGIESVARSLAELEPSKAVSMMKLAAQVHIGAEAERLKKRQAVAHQFD